MAKVLIDIPEQYLKLIHSDSPINWVSMSGFLNFVRNGIALNELTNGEVMQKMFPNARCNTDDWKNLVWFGITEDNSVLINKKWWNQKWGEA